MKPEISVILPVYNAQDYLVDAIESILEQDFTDFELIVIDDGSSDSSPKLIKSLANDARVRIITNETNRGLIYSLNLGLENAQGHYIARMDADDIAFPNRLSVQRRFLDQNQDIFLVAGSFYYIDSEGQRMGKQNKDYSHDQIERYILKSGIIHHPTVMYRNEGQYRYRDKALYCEDRDLWLRMMTDGRKMHIISDIILEYRLHSESVCARRHGQETRFINQVVFWYHERKKSGTDSYASFDPGTILDESPDSDKYLRIVEMKLLFKSGNQSKTLRRKIIGSWKDYGLFVWLPALVILPITLLPTWLEKRISAALVGFYE